MKNMKNKILIPVLLTAFLTTLLYSSCKKYPDGPNFSLRSRSERLANRWEIENYKINGTDFTSLVSGYSETYSKKGAYSYTWGILNGSGNWDFQNADKEIKLTGSDGQSSRRLYILKLEEKSFWYYYYDGTDKYDLHLVSN